MSECYFWLILGAFAAALFAFLVTLTLLLKARGRPTALEAEVAKATAELDRLQEISAIREKNLLMRMEDKDSECQKAIAEKTESCKCLVEATERAKIEAVAAANKAAADAITARDSACEAALAEKVAVCNQKLAVQASACEQQLKEKDSACAKLLAEKEAAIRSREEACEAALKEKDSDMAKREVTWQQMLDEKDRACTQALQEKDAACAKLLEEKDAVLKRKEDDLTKLLADRDAQQAKVIQEKNAEIERFFGEKEKSFAEVVKTLREQFANVAVQTLKIQSGDLTKCNSQQLEAVLKPLREQVESLKSATEKTQTEHAKLAEAIGKDVGRISDVAKELAGVSEALSSNTRFQGRKGEEILAEKLRQAGLEENVNFFLQQGTDTDRPDAQVCDTENRWLIIDSKVVLTAYFQYVEAKDEAIRERRLSEHVSRIREKIDMLARKNYPKVFASEHRDRNYLPVTAMFVGYEAPLLEALKAEPSLWKRAADNNVILVTPLTLLAYLRLVYLAWQHEKEARNQQEIVNTARELLLRMNNFLMTFEALGESLVGVQDEYNKAKGVLVDAPHAQTIAKAANKLIDLHVRLESRRGKRLEKAECLKVLDEDAIQLQT